MIMAIDAFSELEDLGDGQKPWCDLVLEMTEIRNVGPRKFFVEDRPISIQAIGSAQIGDIGIGAVIPRLGWKAQTADEDITVHWANIELYSLGKLTDTLVGLYEDWFDFPHSGLNAAGKIECLAVMIGGDPRSIDKTKINSKLFFDPHTEQVEQYGELFFNFDIKARKVWLKEKDPEYRLPVVRWLTGQYTSARSAS
jgi:hypothetical protein